MAASFRLEGGIAAIVGGSMLVSGHLFDYAGAQPAGTPGGKLLVLAGHVALVFAFVGLYSYQHDYGPAPVGRAGMILGVVGTVLVSAIVFVELAGASGVDTTSVFEAVGTTTLSTVGPLLFILGMGLVGASTLGRDEFSRLGGWLLLGGAAAFVAASTLPGIAGLLTVCGAALTAAGFEWLGITLLKTDEQRTTAVDLQAGD